MTIFGILDLFKLNVYFQSLFVYKTLDLLFGVHRIVDFMNFPTIGILFGVEIQNLHDFETVKVF